MEEAVYETVEGAAPKAKRCILTNVEKEWLQSLLKGNIKLQLKDIEAEFKTKFPNHPDKFLNAGHLKTQRENIEIEWQKELRATETTEQREVREKKEAAVADRRSNAQINRGRLNNWLKPQVMWDICEPYYLALRRWLKYTDTDLFRNRIQCLDSISRFCAETTHRPNLVLVCKGTHVAEELVENHPTVPWVTGADKAVFESAKKLFPENAFQVAGIYCQRHILDKFAGKIDAHKIAAYEAMTTLFRLPSTAGNAMLMLTTSGSMYEEEWPLGDLNDVALKLFNDLQPYVNDEETDDEDNEINKRWQGSKSYMNDEETDDDEDHEINRRPWLAPGVMVGSKSYMNDEETDDEEDHEINRRPWLAPGVMVGSKSYMNDDEDHEINKRPWQGLVGSTSSTSMTAMASSFHRKELPSTCISLSSSSGRTIFKEALAQGTCETFLSISEAFQSQGEPAFCGIGSLCMTLNALLIDPGRVWKGNWRWFDDTMLDCCDPLEVMKEKGTTIDCLHCLANCNGASSQLRYASSISLDSFREDLIRVCSSNELETVIIVAYDRGVLGQTGSGHFSPIGGYNREKDLLLVMDVARFKYPPHWVSISSMFQAMIEHDPATGKSRGYLLISRDASQKNGNTRCGVDSSACCVGRKGNKYTTTLSHKVCKGGH